MTDTDPGTAPLFEPLELPCGVVLRNRLAKAAMSDSLGDGAGRPTEAQIRLYERWGQGGAGLSLIGEVQIRPDYPEKPGNLVLRADTDPEPFRQLTQRVAETGMPLWAQFGHAGALAFAPLSTPKGPSALDLPGLTCEEMPLAEIEALPGDYAAAAALARIYGFGGIQIHAAHGFLLSQFLSPLFNHRTDRYGGSVAGRAKLLLDVIEEVRKAVGPDFPIGVRINATDMLEGGQTTETGLALMALLDETSVDLIDISGGTYFPGAKAASDGRPTGPYFLDFARAARGHTGKPLMLSGGFKTWQDAADAVADGSVDMAGVARAFVVDPDLPAHWRISPARNPDFPRFDAPPDGGITAWYTMRLTQIGEDRDHEEPLGVDEAIRAYETRDANRVPLWTARFDHN